VPVTVGQRKKVLSYTSVRGKDEKKKVNKTTQNENAGEKGHRMRKVRWGGGATDFVYGKEEGEDFKLPKNGGGEGQIIIL